MLCNAPLTVTADGLVVTCKSCAVTLCSWCDECDNCAEARKEVEYGIYGAQDY